MRFAGSASPFSAAMARWMSAAHCTASTALANSAISPSPTHFTGRPPYSTMRGSIVPWRIVLRSASVAVSSARISLL
jgi:hypothetical protein